MNKLKFFKILKKFETVELFLTTNIDSLEAEIYHNMICIEAYENISKEISVDEIISFLHNVKTNRKEQLVSNNNVSGLKFYLWVDEMANQLRFNFINSSHIKLPFNCDLKYVSDEKLIVKDFLNSDNSIIWDSLNEAETNAKENQDYTLKIYSELIEMHHS